MTVLGLVSIFGNWNLMPGGVSIILIIVTLLTYTLRLSSTGACRQRRQTMVTHVHSVWKHHYIWVGVLALSSPSISGESKLIQRHLLPSGTYTEGFLNYSILLWGGVGFILHRVTLLPVALFWWTHGRIHTSQLRCFMIWNKPQTHTFLKHIWHFLWLFSSELF